MVKPKKKRTVKNPNLKSVAVRYNKLENEFYQLMPRLYGFLVAHGVSSDIADAAQVLVSQHWLDISDRSYDILKKIYGAEDQIYEVLESKMKRILSIADVIEQG